MHEDRAVPPAWRPIVTDGAGQLLPDNPGGAATGPWGSKSPWDALRSAVSQVPPLPPPGSRGTTRRGCGRVTRARQDSSGRGLLGPCNVVGASPMRGTSRNRKSGSSSPCRSAYCMCDLMFIL